MTRKKNKQDHQKLQRVLIMAGGTGGHVFPGLAVARYMIDHGVHVHWLGTHEGLEARVIPDANIPLHFIHIAGLRGKGIASLLLAPFKITSSVNKAYQIIRKVKPDIVIGMGGFVSGPGGVACRLLNIPLIIHEQNAKAGLTNKILAKIAIKVLQAFPNTFPTRLKKVITTGNPVRVEIENIPSPTKRHEGDRPYRLLVLGGSLGARALNEAAPLALSQMKVSDRPEIWHQTGDKHFSPTQEDYDAKHLKARIQPFISDMAEAYQWADVVLCRAGALTVAELCAAGRGAIFVPYPFAVDDHQTANADFMVKHGAAECIQQADLTAAGLAGKLSLFATNPDMLLVKSKAAYRLRQTKVAENIFEICQRVIDK